MMNRKKLIFVFLLLSTLLVGILFAKQNLKNQSIAEVQTLLYIPNNASFVFFYNQFNKTKQTITDSEYGYHIENTALYKRFTSFEDAVQTFYSNYNESTIPQNRVTSIHISGGLDFAFITSVSLPGKVKAIKKQVRDSSCGEHSYMGQTIYCIQTQPKLYATQFQHEWVISDHSSTLEDAINHYKESKSLVEKAYNSLKLANHSRSHFRVLVQPKEAVLLSNQFMKPNEALTTKFINFSNWMFYEIDFKPEDILLTGKVKRASFKAPIDEVVDAKTVNSFLSTELKEHVYPTEKLKQLQKEIAGVVVKDVKNGQHHLSKIGVGFGDINLSDLLNSQEVSTDISTAIDSNEITEPADTTHPNAEFYTAESAWTYQPKDRLVDWTSVIQNHRTNAKNIVLQTSDNQLILINQNGVEKWRKQLNGAIISPIRQIDIYGNNKLQLLFNTKTDIYLVDILGRDVKGFPIKLLKPATGSLLHASYEDGTFHRFFVPTKDGVLGYKKDGNILNEFNPNTLIGSIDKQMQYSNCSEKDVLVATNRANELLILNRRGELRVPKIELKEALKTPFVFDDHCNLIAVANSGKVYQATLDGELSTSPLTEQEALPIIYEAINPQQTFTIDGIDMLIEYKNGLLKALPK